MFRRILITVKLLIKNAPVVYFNTGLKPPAFITVRPAICCGFVLILLFQNVKLMSKTFISGAIREFESEAACEFSAFVSIW